MISSDMIKLRSLYAELDRCLERGESCGPEVERLYAEVYRLTPPGEEIWVNFDPIGRADPTAA